MLTAYDNRQEASAAAARYIARALVTRLEHASGKISLVVSGGTTPVECFARLAAIPLAWERVQVTLTDERDVAPEAAESNERLVREHLLQDRAASAEFVPLAADRLQDLVRPHACALVGMGEDGHFASLFPDLADLEQYLDPGAPARLVRVTTSASPLSRTSMNLSMLLASDTLLLLAFGERKRQILQAPSGYPVAALLRHGERKLHILWSP